MQANCCVFPAPSKYDFGQIINNILLIPKFKDTLPQFYHDKYILKTLNQKNSFIELINYKKGIKFERSISTAQSLPQDKKFEVYTALNQMAQKRTQNIIRHKNNTMTKQYTHQNIEKVKQQIPCLFIQNQNSSKQKIMIFFHGNGQDLSSSYDFAYFISKELQIPVLVMEYQGYSIYEGSSSSSLIINDAKIIINSLLKYGYKSNQLIMFGRSIGGAIAFQAASHYDVRCLILLSPFLSLKKVAEDIYGKCASTLVRQTLDNAEIAQTVKCPILIIHGLKDTLVPYHHSVSILALCKGFTRLKLAENMTHVKFNFKYDFIMPVKKFLVDFEIIKETI